MSDMNYEKAWGNLKRRLMCVALYSRHFAESKKHNADACLRARGGEAIAVAILEFMEDVEEKMTTVRDDDGQSAQD